MTYLRESEELQFFKWIRENEEIYSEDTVNKFALQTKVPNEPNYNSDNFTRDIELPHAVQIWKFASNRKSLYRGNLCNLVVGNFYGFKVAEVIS